MRIFVMSAWIAGIQVRKDAFGNIHLTQISGDLTAETLRAQRRV
jgi:hypothetical protein